MAVWTGHAVLDPVYLWVSRGYLLLSVLFYVLLRDHPRRLMPVAGCFSAVSCLLHGATLTLNLPDELRIIWFLLNLPATYLVLGLRAGDAIAIASAIFIVAVNSRLPTPYTPSAIVTCLMGLAYLSLLFRAFTARSVSFHHSMVEANRQLADMATRLAEKLRADIEARMPETPAGQLRVTASIGVAQSSHGNKTIADIQRQADQAMYEAKRQGRNRVTALS